MSKKVVLGVAALAVVVIVSVLVWKQGGDEKKIDTVKAKYRIGLAFAAGGLGDLSFNDSAYKGFVELARIHGGFIKNDPAHNYGTNIEMQTVELVPGGESHEGVLRSLAEAGYDLIFSIGFLYSEPAFKIGAEFPTTFFSVVDGFVPEGHSAPPSGHISLLSFREAEGSFLVGAIAGLTTKSNKVGFIGGVDIPLIRKFQIGYLAGAAYVNSALRDPKNLPYQFVGKDYGGFTDPKTAESIARTLYGDGADVIYHAAGNAGSGLFRAALKANKWAIGVDSDQGAILANASTEGDRVLADRILSSMVKKVYSAVFAVGEEFVESDKVTGGYRSFGIKEDAVGYAYNQYNKDKIDPIQEQLEMYRTEILSGKIQIPDKMEQLWPWIESLK